MKLYYSPPSSFEVKNVGAIPPLPHMSSWYSAEMLKHRDNFAVLQIRLRYMRSIGIRMAILPPPPVTVN
jgi:hypothetical protein